MEGGGDQGPDAAPIKPVSSLRAKFEGLQGQDGSGNSSASSRPAVSSLKPIDPTGNSSLTRASLDLPRPHSPWNSPAPATSSRSQTPQKPDRTSESPSRSNHKRPMSMVFQSTPQLTPAVKIESPKSPPSFIFARSASRSPERLKNETVGNDREQRQRQTEKALTYPSAQSQRSGIVHPTEFGTTSTDGLAKSQTRPRSPIPPQVNRAEKPKVPVKPRNISPMAKGLSTPQVNLATKPPAPTNNSRVSPFNTPPSSDGEGEVPQMVKSDTDGQVLGQSNLEINHETGLEDIPRSRDPRFMGFSGPKVTRERKDPREMGLSSSISSLRDTEEVQPTKNPARILTTPASPGRSALDFGFTNNSPSVRPEPQAPVRKLSVPQTVVDTAPKPTRDARQFGFGGTGNVPVTPVDQSRTDLAQRTTPKMPPPRPSEDSKRPAYLPGISHSTSRTATSNPSNPTIRRSEDVPRQTITTTSDVRFPPPPKRGVTLKDDDSRNQDLLQPPTPVPPRRRSLDTASPRDDDSDDAEDAQPEPVASRHDYPDASQTNRRPPISTSDHSHIYTKSDGRAFDICGQLLCTASYHTKLFDLRSGSEILDLNHGETVKTTAIVFKPGAGIDTEGKRIWIGNNIGELQEIDLETHVTIAQSSAHNRREIFRILRHKRDLWTLDEEGKLLVWPGTEEDLPNLKYSHKSHKLAKPPTYAMIVKDTLWAASGKELRIYKPGHESTFNVLQSPLVHTSGDITCGTFSEAEDRVYIGHVDGNVSVYTLNGHQCISNVKVSIYKINAMAMVGDKLWAVYKTGKVYVYDTSSTPWKIRKDWKAHSGPATGILLDPSSAWTMGRLQVATTGQDQFVRLWDGMLEDDWVETAMNQKDVEYCTFRDVRAAVTTWNCGAASPSSLRTDFIAEAIHSQDADPPEILVFGFQEVVDLEDRAVTAKSIFGFGKKKENRSTPDQQHQSRIYREWRDYLSRAVARYLPNHHYTELHTSSLIGLFSCIFVRTTEKANISNHAMAQVKCGLGGHYGNKGALLARFVIDSSSLCFINCHLAAGQTHTSQRNENVAVILESEALPSETDQDVRTSLYMGGGDGAQILDHEICILNGDLNYRIDAMPRDLVIKHINNGDLSKLLERDQILLSRKRVAGFRLAQFTELPIQFAPTYKYDVGRDTYDSSEKKRSPAWCDRLLYRSVAGRVKQLEYKRHDDVRYSDHRPVSGVFRLKIKRVDEAKRRESLRVTYAQFEKMRRGVLEQARVNYLVFSFGVGREEAKRLVIKGAS